MSSRRVQDFQEKVWAYYAANRRVMPWRDSESDGTYDPYKILVSEVMLQQTQAQRVIPKYLSFLERFPDIDTLAKAELGEVLREWSGLGYNRRAKYLHDAAKTLAVMDELPKTLNELSLLPGVGKNTAAAILVYSFNQPMVFIETNIRTVYIYEFFQDSDQISDAQLLPLVEETLVTENPREWYWALMDYGGHLKKTIGNLSRSSKHYTKQSKFEGSTRQLRGKVLRLLADRPYPLLGLETALEDERLYTVIDALTDEGMITLEGNSYRLS